MAKRDAAINEASKMFGEMTRREDGETALFSALGHKGDLMIVHFRRGFEELAQAEHALATLALSDYLEPTTSYLSVIEIGLYEATVALYRKLVEQGIGPHSPQWKSEIESEITRQREKISPRLFPKIPARPYLCFYPMDKKRDGADNWYRLPIEDRQRLMHDHGMVGRRFAGEVTQIISGSIGFDDWEWGVDLFADDPSCSRNSFTRCASTRPARRTRSSAPSTSASASTRPPSPNSSRSERPRRFSDFVARQRQLGYNPEAMKKAKIAELRNGLSRYLDHVRAGGSVVVYDRDTPIAEIVPLTRSKSRNKRDLDEARLARLEAKGAIKRPTGDFAAWLKTHKPIKFPGGPAGVVQALLEERESGW